MRLVKWENYSKLRDGDWVVTPDFFRNPAWYQVVVVSGGWFLHGKDGWQPVQGREYLVWRPGLWFRIVWQIATWLGWDQKYRRILKVKFGTETVRL